MLNVFTKTLVFCQGEDKINKKIFEKPIGILSYISEFAKFDGIRMQDLVQVKDPDEEGGLTLVFKDDKLLKIKVVDGKLVSESIPE